MKQEVQKVQEIKNMKGIAKFPFWDDETEKFSMKLLIGKKELDYLNDLMEHMEEEIAISELEHDGETYNAINLKTGYTIPIFDREGNQINADTEDYCIYDGAKIIAKINFKKYEYTQKKGRNSFKKTGITGYLMGVVILEQGTPYQAETTFDDFAEELNDEDLQF